MSPRILRLINVSIAVLVLLLCGLVYWFAWRPLPQTTGEIAAPIGAAATVSRDAQGIPHIEAASWQDAIFLQGYATAEDRLWQMDGLRRYGAGELAEIAGPAAVALDQRSRQQRMKEIAEAEIRGLTPEERVIFSEYARGVNLFIDTHRGKYSLEFSIPGRSYDPRPWTPVDSALVGLVMFRDLTGSYEADLAKMQLAQTAPPDKLERLFPRSAGQMERPGSNGWAVSGAHAANGKPMLANDPHLSYGIPPTWHLVHLKAPGLEVSGATLPGVPGVISGHNRDIAWGVTNLQTDEQDLYIEQIDRRTGRYAFNGKVEQAQLDRQVIGVLGGKPVQLDTWVTRHGPVIATDGQKGFALRWTATDGFGFPFLDVNRAHNWEEFRAALSRFWGPPQNFVFADRNGNIGYQATGRLPVRRDFYGDLPLDGASGKFEWEGYIPFEQMPSLYNPPSGVIVTANQSAFPDDYPFHINGSFADKYRVQQIRARLNAKKLLTVDDMLAIQKDVYAGYDFFLGQQVLAAAGRHATDGLREAASVLRGWNGQMDKDEAAPVITELLSEQMAQSLLQSIAGNTKVELAVRPQVIEDLLRERPAGWVAKNDWDDWISVQLAAALETGRKLQGSPASKWKWGRMREWTFGHPVGKALPLVNGFFNIGPVPMSGSGTTVKQTTRVLGPSMRLVVDFGDLEHSVQNLTTGESGYVASPHYKDEWESYYTGKSFPMQFDHVDAKDVLRISPQP